MEQKVEMTLVEAIRKRPAMYIGSTSVRGFNLLLQEIIKFVFNSTKADYFSFELLGKLKGKIIFKNLQNGIFDNAFTNPTWDKSQKEFSPFELVAINALSKNFAFTFYDESKNKLLEHKYEKGILINDEVENIEYFPKIIEMKFDLDDSIFEISEPLNPNFYLEDIRNLAYLYKRKTLAVIYPIANEISVAIFKFENGLKDRIEVEKLKGLGGTYFDTYFDKEFEDFSVEAAFAFREYSVDEPFLISYANEHYTHEDGTHVNGLLKGLTYGVMKHFQKHELTQKYKISEKGMRENLLAAIHIKMEKPQFSGCVRNKLASPEIIEPLAEFVSELLFEKIEKDEESTKQITRKFKIFD